MAKLIYSGIMSLDGYIVDAGGDFQWAAPDEEVFAFVNELVRGVATQIYGRRMYEVMATWEDFDDPEATKVERDFAELWRADYKIVISTTLDEIHTGNTDLFRTLDLEQLREMKWRTHEDISIGGPTLAAGAVAAGLVDEFWIFRHPIVVGGGTPYFPAGVHIDLELIEERRFASGVTFARYSLVRS
jgi:dihydrofolate reductase